MWGWGEKVLSRPLADSFAGVRKQKWGKIEEKLTLPVMDTFDGSTGCENVSKDTIDPPGGAL
jgi:hypothetical protein